ncbi:hypothetical protein SADUNF_Sadunf16G0130300 [Salix dunnii]|uniref:Cyclin-dependent protein kinase inhibitor SMR3 n=1 Tax=Salix dunnii TaxID=1413687 RepID=A0A835MGV0_9ROSI|nr:hypothetical protein SADUNF_Sadunf16G0130300 [Salix dunnii]
MFSELKSFSLKGLPNSEKEPNPKEFNFHVRSTLELGDDCENVLQELHHQEKEVGGEGKQEENCGISVPTLKIKLPSLGAFQIEDNDHGDVSKTPTSSDCKIPDIFQCPPAPRKPKSLPSTNRKSPRRRVFLDLSNEVETLFPPALAANLGCKIKKVRQGNDTK